MGPTQASPGGVRFGVFEADLRTGQLRKSGVKVRIQDLPFRTLAVLLSRPGEIVSREQLRQALWPGDVFVDFDQGISSAIRRLRDALGDSADNPVFIETVERKGYRWIAPIRPPQPAAPEPVKEEKQDVTAAVTLPKRSPWWKLVLVFPVLALLFAVWISRPIYRYAKAGAKPKPAASLGSPRHAANREAEDFYLKGRFYWNKRTPESLNQAVDSFTQAIVHDPSYAPAYVGLADCYNLLREYSMMPASEAYPRALAAAIEAVELDDQSSEAHASLAFVSFYGMWDVGTADQEFRRAIDLDPNNSKAHHWYATFLSAIRRVDEALNEINRAQTLDPNSPSVLADKGRILWIAGRHDEALQLLKQIEAAEPDFLSPHRYLKVAYIETADYSDYLSEMRKEAVLLHDSSSLAIVAAAEKGFAAHGATGMLTSELQEEKKLFDQGKLSPYFPAGTAARLGNTPEALKYLEACYGRHAEETLNTAIDPAFNGLRSAPAFQQLLAKVGLPPIG